LKAVKFIVYFVAVMLFAAIIAYYSFSISNEIIHMETVNKFADNGVNVIDVLSDYNNMIIKIPSETEEVSPEDIMNIRKTVNVIRTVVFDRKTYTIELISPSGKKIYSDFFYNLYNRNDSVVYDSEYGDLDVVMIKYQLKYDLKKNGFQCRYSRFYESSGMKDEALYSEIVASKIKLADAVETYISAINALNDKNCRIFRYSAVFYDEYGNALAVVSRDLWYGDVIFWKSSECSYVKTMFG